jgi:hypothetical protein
MAAEVVLKGHLARQNLVTSDTQKLASPARLHPATASQLLDMIKIIFG